MIPILRWPRAARHQNLSSRRTIEHSNSRIIIQTYDPTFNQPLTSTDPLGQVTSYAYDATGNLTTLTDPLGHSTTFTYNAFGQPVTATDALGNTSTF